ncbi:MAG: hypothetical protein PWP48_1473 [Clostridiales bacterium]|nr:hypothetical protein [Clostridiales bacterium]
MKVFNCDVLVIGGGGAALRAAIAAKERYPGTSVLLITKGTLGKSGTTANARSDRMAFHATLEHTLPGGPDAWKYHADDIYRIGGMVSDYDLAEILAKNSAEAFYYLDRLGVPFVKKDGLPVQFLTDGSIYPRACYTGPDTAIDIEKALLNRFLELSIPFKDHSMIYKLAVNSHGICGAFGVTEDDDVFAVNPSSIVMATGGAGRIYKDNVFPKGATSDGYALALECGAPLVNMEFIQIGLCSRTTKLACSGSMMRAVPRFIDEEGHEFLPDYIPDDDIYDIVFQKGASWPLSYEHPSHVIDIAVFKEINAGHKVYLDFSKNPVGFDFSRLSPDNRKRYNDEIQIPGMEGNRNDNPLARLKEINPNAVQWLKSRGIDLEIGQKLEIMPAAQHFQGGIKIRTNADTPIAGLFAAGECAGGQHGANRPGGNSLLDGQVFGKIAGEAAAARSQTEKPQTIGSSSLERQQLYTKALREMRSDISLSEQLDTVQQMMNRQASVMRTGDGLADALSKINKLTDMKPDMKGQSLYDYFEAKSSIMTAIAVLLSASARKESRGPHLYFNSMEDLIPLPSLPEYQHYFTVSYGQNGWHVGKGR